MPHMHIKKRRIRKLVLPKQYNLETIQIGVLVIGGEEIKVGLSNNGDVVLPAGIFGPQSKKNAYGYSYSDKTNPKESRYVTTNWIYPYGNTDAEMIAVDIYRKCYPKVEVSPYGIELQLYINKSGQKYVMAILNDDIREKYIMEAINLCLEIYGECYIFDGEICMDNSTKYQRCNWKILPPGEMPSQHIKKQLQVSGRNTDTYDVFRLEHMEKYKSEKIVEGINGFNGYYAYVFNKCCVLESAIYGNATYIIPKENWEKLSQKTKKELFDENKVIAKINHTEKWEKNINKELKELGIEFDV